VPEEAPGDPEPGDPGGGDRPLLPRLGVSLAVFGVSTGLLHVLGVGGYRTGFFGVFLPIAALSAGTAWFALGRLAERPLWTGAIVVAAATVAGLLASAAPPSRGVLLAEARDLLPPFYEESSHETAGHSWCRPGCPSATLVAKPPATGAPAVMVEIATSLFVDGVLSQEDLTGIARRRTFAVTAPEVAYHVSLEGEGADRRLRITLDAR